MNKKYPIDVYQSINLDDLDSSYVDLYHLTKKLKDILHPDIVNQLESITHRLHQALDAKNNYDENKEDILYTKCDELAKQHQFTSIWSISISPDDFSQPFSDQIVRSVSYKGMTIETNKEVTWLGMWIYADKLIKQSEDKHHIFIEDFVESETQPGHYKLLTGS